MGVDALKSNGITKKFLYLIKDKNITSKQDPLNKVRKSRILLFIGVQLLGFGATFAITQTVGKLIWTTICYLQHNPNSLFFFWKAAIGFPVFIMLLLPIRTLLIPRMSFTNEELAILDGPTASDFVSKLVFPLLQSYLLTTHPSSLYRFHSFSKTMKSVGGGSFWRFVEIPKLAHVVDSWSTFSTLCI